MDRSDWSRLSEIHLIPYSHNDYAWCNTRQWHVRRYIRSIEEVLDLMRTEPAVTWLIDNVLHTLQPFLSRVPERVAELRGRIAEGRIALANGGMSLARADHVGDETFIRNMVEGKLFFQRVLGAAEVEVFYNADVGCGHSQLPQLLSLAGHRFYGFWRPEEALDHKGIPRQFVWQGLDGTTIVASRGPYFGMIENAAYLREDLANQWEGVRREFVELELGEQLGPLPTDIAWLGCGSDDFSLLCSRRGEPVDIPGFVREWNRREKLPLFFSTPQRYFHALVLRTLPVHTGVLDPCELSLNTPLKGNHSIWRLRQRLDRSLVRLETLSAMASLIGSPSDAKADEGRISALWGSLFEITGHAIEWAFEEDANQLHDLASSADAEAARLARERLEGIASALSDHREPGSFHLVANTLSWKREEAVKLHVSDPLGIKGFDLVDSRGRRVEYQVVEWYRRWNPYPGCDLNAVDVLAEVEVPALGCCCLRYERTDRPLEATSISESTERSFTMGNRRVEVSFDRGLPRGTRVVDEDGATGTRAHPMRAHSVRARPVIQGIGGLCFVHTRPESSGIFLSWEETAVSRFLPEQGRLLEAGPIRWVYRLTGRIGAHRVEQDIILMKGESAVGFSVAIDCQGGEGYFAADFPADPGTEIQADVPFGVEPRDLAAELYGPTGRQSLYAANSYERGSPGMFWARSWVLFKARKAPIAIVSQDCSIYYRYRAPGHSGATISLLLNRCLPLRSRKLAPADQWAYHCHPRMDGVGRHTFNFWVLFPREGWGYADVARFAREKAHPLQATWSDHGPRRRSPGELSDSLLSMDQKNIILSAFSASGDRYLARFFETEGRRTALAVRLAFQVEQAEVVDLLGNAAPATPVAIDEDGRTVRLEVKPWQIVTLALRALEERGQH